MRSRPDVKHQQLGGRLGPRLAQIVRDSHTAHLLGTADYRAKLHAEGLNEFFRGMSREKHQFTSPLWALFLGAEDTPPELEEALRFIAHGQGELSEVMGSLGLGQAVGTSILSGISNYLAPINQRLIATQPNSLVDPATLAAAVARGWTDEDTAKAEAARGGINSGRFNLLHNLALQYPSLTEMLTLWRRGEIDEEQVVEGLERIGLHSGYTHGLLSLKRQHLQPADAALMVLKGIMSEGEGTATAGYEGLDPQDFHKLVLATGEPPGLMQLLEAYRRGFIDKERLEKGIKQSRVRDEWADVVERLRFVPASPSDALRGVVQHHISEAEGKQIAEWGGLRPEDWDWLVQTEGNPLAVGESLSLYNRGLMSQAEVEQAMRESRLKDKYTSKAMHLHVKLPPAFQIGKMVATGSMTMKRAAELLRWEGYPDDVAQSFVHSSSSDQAAKAKNIAEGQVLELYHDHALTEAEALAHLEALGYHGHNAKLLLTTTDLKRDRTLQEAALSPIRTAYVGRHINEQEASSDIDKLRIASTQRDYLLALWNIERASHRKLLTEAQIVKANEKELFTDEVALERLQGLGYTESDARLLLDLEKGRKAPA